MINRNIITDADVRQIRQATTVQALPKGIPVPPGADEDAYDVPPGLRGPGGAVAQPAKTGPGGVAIPTSDDYLTRLLKFVPVEILGFYLLMSGVVDSNVAEPRAHSVWLGCLLIGTLALTAVYDVRILNVVRPAQIVVSILGLAVYVFAAGGWFATTTWYHAWYGSMVVPLFALSVGMIKLNPLPAPPADDATTIESTEADTTKADTTEADTAKADTA